MGVQGTDRIYMISQRGSIQIGSTDPVIFYICDDCNEAYLGPTYYTFEPDACHVYDDGGPHKGCTANVCPSCAGPYIAPDDEDDPRRPNA